MRTISWSTSKVKRIPLFFLKFVSRFLDFEWGQNISDRLAFVEILDTENNFRNQHSIYTKCLRLILLK
jgi:hypothetical protein